MEGTTYEPLDGQSVSTDAQTEGNSALRSKTAKRKRIRQLIQTAILFYSFFCIGVVSTIIGPTLLDLQRNTRTSTETISYMFTACSFGALGGAVLAGFIVDRFNDWILLIIVMAMIGPLNILIPYMENLWALLIIFSLSGGAVSFLITAGTMYILKVWGKENGPWLQALHFMIGVGTMIGPLLAEPFLRSQDIAPTINQTVDPENSTGVYKVLTNSTLKAVMENVSVAPLDNMTEPSGGDAYESKVYWAYLIAGLMAILAFVLFLGIAIFCKEIKFQCLNMTKKSKITEEKIQEEDNPEDKVFRLQILSSVFFFYVFYFILEPNYGNYLSLFAVKGLDWSEKEGALVAAAYWGMFTAGRGLGIILVKVLPPWVLLAGDLAISVVSLFVLTIFSHSHYMVLWVCTLTLGFGISTIFATGITWTEQYIRITGAAGSVFIIAGGVGRMVGPIIIGAVFTSIGPRSFLFVMCSAVCLLVVLFGVMEFMGRRHVKGKHLKPPAESTA